MKKLLAFVLAAVMMISLVACGGGTDISNADDPIVGVWAMTEMSAGGVTMTVAQIADMGLDMSIEFDMKANGKLEATATQGGETETSDGDWKANGDTYEITFDGQTAPATLEDGKLSMEIEGNQVVFEKK